MICLAIILRASLAVAIVSPDHCASLFCSIRRHQYQRKVRFSMYVIVSNFGVCFDGQSVI